MIARAIKALNKAHHRSRPSKGGETGVELAAGTRTGTSVFIHKAYAIQEAMAVSVAADKKRVFALLLVQGHPSKYPLFPFFHFDQLVLRTDRITNTKKYLPNVHISKRNSNN